MRGHLPMQGTWLQSPLREGSARPGAAKPVCRNCGGCTLKPVHCNRRSYETRSLGTMMRSNPARLPHLKKAHAKQRRPNAAKLNIFFFKVSFRDMEMERFGGPPGFSAWTREEHVQSHSVSEVLRSLSQLWDR